VRKLVVTENVTLDDVMQTPGCPYEDSRGGFAHGGRALPGVATSTGVIIATYHTRST